MKWDKPQKRKNFHSTYHHELRTITRDCHLRKVDQLYRKHHVRMHHIPKFDEVALKRKATK